MLSMSKYRLFSKGWTLVATGLLCGAFASILPACRSSPSTSPYAQDVSVARNSLEAQALNTRAAELLDSDAVAAEGLLRQALTADLYFGPAHNNLGVVYLLQGKLYEAAGEFEWARKLMPGHPDPRMNLALTLDTAGRTEDAIVEYNSALEVYPEHLPTIQALTRLQIRSGKRDERTPSHLSIIALQSNDTAWREWAKQQLAEGL